MKKWFRSLYKTLVCFGIDFRKTLFAIRGIPYYLRDLKKLLKQQKQSNRLFMLGDPNFCLADRFEENGITKGHYFYQDWFVANRIFDASPENHIDVGSRIDGFVTHIASFRSIQVIDIRPLTVKIPNINFIQADIMSPLSEKLYGSCDSLSCLHTLEHLGLGRYSDPVEYDGYVTGLNNLADILKKNGKFYFSIPFGPQRIEFNAHRVFSLNNILELLEEKFRIDYFSFIDDDGELHVNIDLSIENITSNFGCNYGCGIFEMTKL